MKYNNEEMESIYSTGLSFKIQQKRPEWMDLLNIINTMKNVNNIVEIGANTGGTTVTLSYFAKKLISIDIINPALFDVKSINQCQYEYVANDSKDENVFKYIKEKMAPIDVLMIDGDHSHEGSYADYLLYKDLVKDGGIIIFHDIVDSPNHRQHRCYVSKTWEIVKQNHKVYKEIIYTNNFEQQTLSDAFHEKDSWGGIGVVWK